MKRKYLNKVFLLLPLLFLLCGTIPVFSQVPQLGPPNLLQQALNLLPAIPIPGVGSVNFAFGGDAWMAKLNGKGILAGTITLHNTDEGNIIILKQTHIFAGVAWIKTPGADINLEYKKGPPVSFRAISRSELDEKMAAMNRVGYPAPSVGQAPGETQAGGMQASNASAAPILPKPANIADIAGITPPATGKTPVTRIMENEQYGGTVTWSPAVSGAFAVDTRYTATITLTTKAGYTLEEVEANFFKVPGAATVSYKAGSRVISAAFPATVVSGISTAAIRGVTIPITGKTPVTAIDEMEEYGGTVKWSPEVSGAFAISTEYTATITLTPNVGYTLQGVTANFFTVPGAASTNNKAGSGVVTAVFPVTTEIGITIATIKGVTIPVTGNTPITKIAETEQYSGTVKWSPAVSETFCAGTQYTATITLIPKNDYTLNRVAANLFKVAGAESTSNKTGSGVVTAVFPATQKKVFPEDAKIWSLGASLGTSSAPLFFGTAHGTLAPFKKTFFDLGMDIGGGINRDDANYFSMYPFANFVLLVPFARAEHGKRCGWYIGTGVGAMIAKYTFEIEGPIWGTTAAMNIVTGFNIEAFDVSYTLRTNFNSTNGKLAVGYVYRFK